jgi:hypothetical protein
MYCKVPVLNSIFVIQSKERNPDRDKIKRTLNIKKRDDNKINSEFRN